VFVVCYFYLEACYENLSKYWLLFVKKCVFSAFMMYQSSKVILVITYVITQMTLQIR